MDVSDNSVIQGTFLDSKWFNPDYLFVRGSEIFDKIVNFFTGSHTEIISLYQNALIILAFFFLIILSYTVVRMFEIRAKERKHLAHEIAEYAQHQAEREAEKAKGEGVSKNERWIKTLSYLYSQHVSDWKLAVIEADSMLEGLLDQLGFTGESLGAKLKTATQDKFRSLTSAWEVHTVRNRIAHEGTSFELSQHEAKRVIAIYEQIFREYGYI